VLAHYGENPGMEFIGETFQLWNWNVEGRGEYAEESV
jgi:hypothetical protein